MYGESEIKIYSDLIVLWMIRFGGLTKDEALENLNRANLFYTESGQIDDLIFHEEPYYWAMALLFGLDNTEWFHNVNWWPPPKEYRELVERYESGEISP